MEDFRPTSTWERYKLGQNKFTTWLKETAAKLVPGSKAAASSQLRSTNGIKKITGNRQLSAKYIVHWTELAPLAQTIVTQAPLRSLSYNFIRVLRDVIAHRKKANTWFQRSSKGDAASIRSNEGHLYHIKVLENVLSIFENAKDKFQAETADHLGTNDMSKEEIEMRNLFEVLEIEDPIIQPNGEIDDDSEADSASIASSQLSKKKNAKSKKKGKGGKVKKTTKMPRETLPDAVPTPPPRIEYEMEMDESDEYLMIYCFFEDFNQIREHLQERWCDYQEGMLSISVVSVITDTAFDMFQRAEKDLMTQLPPRSPLRHYEGMSNMLFFGTGLKHVDYESQKGMNKAQEDEAMYQEADWVGLPTYWALNEFLNNAPEGKISVDHYARMERENSGWGQYRVEERRRMTRNVLNAFISEMTLVKALKRQSNFRIPAEDELTRGITRMLKDRHIPTWLVFACQIYVDIRYVLEDENDLEAPHEELIATGERLHGNFQEYIDFMLDIAPTPKLAQLTQGEIECWITDDFMEPARTDLHNSHGIPAEDVEPCYLLRQHPLLCGLMNFRFNLTMQELGLQYSGSAGAIVAIIHLYNAVRQEVGTSISWVDIETLIRVHGEHHIFQGPRPTSSSEYFERRVVSSNIAPSEFMRNKRAGQTIPKRGDAVIGPADSDGSLAGLDIVSVVSFIFHERYCFGRRDDHIYPGLSLDHVEALLHSADATTENPVLSRGMPVPIEWLKVKPWEAGRWSTRATVETAEQYVEQFWTQGVPRRATPVQLLDTLYKQLRSEEVVLHFNYLSLHKRSTLLLRAIYEEFEEEVEALHGGPLLESEMALPFLAGHILLMVKDEDKLIDQFRAKGVVVERMEKVMRPFIEREGDAEVKAVRNILGIEEGLGRRKWKYE